MWLMVRLDQLRQLIESENELAWCDSLFNLARSLGFDSVLLGVVASRHADLESAFVRSNFPEEWRELYHSNKLYNVDPTVRHCMCSALPLAWSPPIFKTPLQSDLYQKACSFGLGSGISLPIHGSSGEVGLISFSARGINEKEFARQVSRYMADLSLVRDFAFHSSLKYVYPSS